MHGLCARVPCWLPVRRTVDGLGKREKSAIDTSVPSPSSGAEGAAGGGLGGGELPMPQSVCVTLFYGLFPYNP